MNMAYISGPIRNKSLNEVYDNIYRARQIAIKYWKLGYAVICPHANTAFMDGSCGEEDDSDSPWIDGDIEFLKRMNQPGDIIVMMPGWKKSLGSNIEYEMAQKIKNLSIIYE